MALLAATPVNPHPAATLAALAQAGALHPAAVGALAALAAPHIVQAAPSVAAPAGGAYSAPAATNVGLASYAPGSTPQGRSLAGVPGQTDVPTAAQNPYMGAPGGPHTPTAPAPSPAATASPALSGFAAQYEQSLAASRAGIEQQLAAALADINAKEAGARQAVGTLPGSLNTIYDTGNATLAQQTGALDAAQKASGLQSYMGAGAQLAPVNDAMTADRAARQADVPLLNIGLAQAASAEHAQLDQARLSAFEQLNQEQRQYDMAQQQAEAQRQAQAAGYAHDQEMANKSFKDQLTLATLKSAASAPPSYGGLVTPASGAQMVQTDPAHVASLRSSPAYGNVVMSLKQLGGAKVNAMLKDPAWLQGYLSGNPAYGGAGVTLSPQAMSLALYDAGYKP